jgi:hypothetical protein
VDETLPDSGRVEQILPNVAERERRLIILLLGGLIRDAVGLREDSDNRQILRMFLNTLIWGTGRSDHDPAAFILTYREWDGRQWGRRINEFDPNVAR